MPGFDIATWTALYLPAATSGDLIARINRDVNKVLALPDLKRRMLDQGIDVGGGTPADHAAYLKSEFTRIGRIVKEANIRAD